MKRTHRYAALMCGAALAVGVSLPAGAQGQQALVIQGGTLLDGNGGPAVPNAVIVVQGDRITAVGRAGQVQVPAGAQVIDAHGKWVTPGLVDAKANWNWQYAEAFLHWGVTSAMVTGTRNDTGIADRDAINHGMWPGPRLYQGYLNLRGGGPDGKRPNNYRPGDGGRVIRTPEEARKMVDYNIAAGADFVSTNDGNAPPAVFAAVAEQAHKAGKGVVMRCVGPQTRGKACVLAGADVMIHTGEIGDEIAKDPDKWKDYIRLPPDPYCDMDPAKEKDMINFLLQHDTAPEPDFIATGRGFPKNWARVQKEDREVFDDPNLQAYYPKYSMANLWENVKSPSTYLTPDKLAHRECGFKNHAKFIGDLIKAGGHAVVASDITQSAPGLGVHQEMAVFQEDAGVAPGKVLEAATSWTAHHFKINDIGSVEKGKLADILIVNADPLKDIKNLRDIDMVIKGGKVIDRGYHAWFRGWLFANNPQTEDFGPVVEGDAWAAALKRATFRPNIAAFRGEPGLPGAIPDPYASPTAGIESVFPHTVPRLSRETTLDIKGFNFVKRSVVYVDDTPVPTQVVSRTEIKATIDPNILSTAGNKRIVVRNPLPMGSDAVWGQDSNAAHLLVPFEFTTKYSHNMDGEDFQK